MNFIGSIYPVRNCFKEICEKARGNWFVGCSGSFVFEKLLSKYGDVSEINSNDVSLYSLAVANLVLEQDFSLSCKDETLRRIFDEWKDSRFKKFIEIDYAYIYKNFEKGNSQYHKYMLNAFVEENRSFYERSIKKYESDNAFGFKVDSFTFGDFVPFLEERPANSFFALFAPTYKGGYEKIFRVLEDTFEYQRAQYNEWDPAKAEVVFGNLLNTGYGCIYTDRKLSGLDSFLKSQILQKNQNKKEIYLYSSLDIEKRYIRPLSSKRIRTPKVIPFEKATVSKIGFAKCKAETVEFYRDKFLKKVTAKSDVSGYCLAFLADGEVFGFAVFVDPIQDGETFYVDMRCDFCVESSISRLSKLLLYLVKSREIKRLLSAFFVKDIHGIQTTVFTDKPCSMKYRGLFKKIRGNKGKLIYRTHFDNLSIDEEFEEWKKKQSTKN